MFAMCIYGHSLSAHSIPVLCASLKSAGNCNIKVNHNNSNTYINSIIGKK